MCTPGNTCMRRGLWGSVKNAGTGGPGLAGLAEIWLSQVLNAVKLAGLPLAAASATNAKAPFGENATVLALAGPSSAIGPSRACSVEYTYIELPPLPKISDFNASGENAVAAASGMLSGLMTGEFKFARLTR